MLKTYSMLDVFCGLDFETKLINNQAEKYFQVFAANETQFA